MAVIKIPKGLPREQAVQQLLNTYPAADIAEALVDYIYENEAEPIIITKEQFQKFFRIRGLRHLDLDRMVFVRENRGRIMTKADFNKMAKENE